MDVLKDASKKNYDYVSRYSSFPYYYNTEDQKYIYGITSQLNDEVTYVAHKVVQSDTLESLAYESYGRPDLFWVIADFNKIQDPFIPLFGNYEVVNIPTLTNISFK